ncbi:MAG TPA: DNA repair protein RecN [Gammaproteobacteria bacterium]|nr:DNA repair protein RecN [Gammaproteobacteria bacterium]
MLMQIHVSNLITIHELNLEFSSGTTVLTGETGTGKSILIDAIELALGSRASEHIVRPGQDKADISLCFDISKLPEAIAWLRNFDLDQGTNECIIRRTISKDGRSRSYINGMPTTLQPLRELSELLIDIHGQHEHQTLLKSEKQREMLDNFAGHPALTLKVASLAEDFRALSQEIMALQKLTQERNARTEFLSFQLQELEELNITPDEFQALDLEHKQLAHAGELLQNINVALNFLTENEEKNSLGLLHQALQALETIQHVDPKISSWVENLKTAVIQISETESDLQHYLNSVDLDPERLSWLENRISTLFDVARKHKISPNELYEFQKKLSTELKELANSDERLNQLSSHLKKIEKQYHETAKKLSESRAKASKKLAKEITTTIHELALPHAEFKVSLDQDTIPDLSPHGLEKIAFEITTNPGQPMQALAKVASGGELSRISLAIHIATAEQHTIPTLIFDEVDVGISGGVAEIVGKLLRYLGNTHQVFCITHLPQVAAQGHHHVRVEKMTHDQITQTHIQSLAHAEKIQEIARMLGGVAITQKTIEHAREMVENVE